MTDKVIRESVSAHKIADVEVGAFLSGGIDSSYIAEAANASKTFTVGFESSDEKIYNEISKKRGGFLPFSAKFDFFWQKNNAFFPKALIF